MTLGLWSGLPEKRQSPAGDVLDGAVQPDTGGDSEGLRNYGIDLGKDTGVEVEIGAGLLGERRFLGIGILFPYIQVQFSTVIKHFSGVDSVRSTRFGMTKRCRTDSGPKDFGPIGKTN